jgi:hypothetical protein
VVTSNDSELVINACLTGEEAAVENINSLKTRTISNGDLRTRQTLAHKAMATS